MKVFLSWSGDQARHIAEFLKTWLPTVLASPIESFISSQDIAKGERGLPVIAKELDQLDFGIAIVTKANVGSPWINFEAGALAKSVSGGRVATVLVDVTTADITGPLSQFQHTSLTDREDVRKLVRDIAKASGSEVPPTSRDMLFEQSWPKLEAELARVSGDSDPVTERTEKDILEEVLAITRTLLRESRTPTRQFRHAAFQESPSDQPRTASSIAASSVAKLMQARELLDHYGDAGAPPSSGTSAPFHADIAEIDRILGLPPEDTDPEDAGMNRHGD